MRKLFFLLLLISSLALISQNASIEGLVVDVENNPISYVNVLLFEKGGTQPLSGSVTDEL